MCIHGLLTTDLNVSEIQYYFIMNENIKFVFTGKLCPCRAVDNRLYHVHGIGSHGHGVFERPQRSCK